MATQPLSQIDRPVKNAFNVSRCFFGTFNWINHEPEPKSLYNQKIVEILASLKSIQLEPTPEAYKFVRKYTVVCR
jgi:hypothetical protein